MHIVRRVSGLPFSCTPQFGQMVICGGQECGMDDCVVHLDLVYCQDGEPKLLRLNSDQSLVIMHHSSLPIDWWGVCGATGKEVILCEAE